MVKKKVFFYQDNGATELLPYSVYSPDLELYSTWINVSAERDIVPTMKCSSKKIKNLGQSYYFVWVKKLEKRWAKCMELKAEFVENKQVFYSWSYRHNENPNSFLVLNEVWLHDRHG